MDIEDLSKSQLLLLTILVNFVVSIATGVLTVSLLDQAPTTVTQTVNRIVDHTIETVTTEVPIAVEGDGGPTTEELLTSAIAGASSRTVMLYRAGSEQATAGVYLPLSKAVVTVSGALPGHVTVKFPNGASLEADRAREDGNLKLYAFPEGTTLPGATASSFVSSSEVKAGQTVIGLDASGGAVTGIVSKVSGDGLSAELPGVPAGAAIVNLAGAIVGISGGGGLYLPAERLDALVSP